MEKRWIFLTDAYAGIEKNAVNLLYGNIASRLPYVLPIRSPQSVTKEELAEANVILVGKEGDLLREYEAAGKIKRPAAPEGYSIYVGQSLCSEENQAIVVAGVDAAGVLYGCADFCNQYLGEVLYDKKDIFTDQTFDTPFAQPINGWRQDTAPAINHRAIWTWGHVIYDYRKFLENMAKLRLNEIVIWNDVAPLNAKDVVEYAHNLNIKVIWGFAWGWGVSCRRILENYDQQALADLKRQVLDTYENQYAATGADGIYFQSFTELTNDSVGGKCIAELVTELVNDIAGSLLERHPDLHIQFGLHATSVRNKLEFIQKVDPRIYIVWEDCGSFPYDYMAGAVSDFEETLAFTETALRLRGAGEKWGAVLKGMLKLDWTKFEHFSAPYILGERTEQYIQQRQQNKDRIWKIQQADWLKNADYARRIIAAVNRSGSKYAVVQALVEDAMLENKIALPVALYAEMLWNPDRNASEMIGQVAKYPCVYF